MTRRVRLFPQPASPRKHGEYFLPYQMRGQLRSAKRPIGCGDQFETEFPRQFFNRRLQRCDIAPMGVQYADLSKTMAMERANAAADRLKKTRKSSVKVPPKAM